MTRPRKTMMRMGARLAGLAMLGLVGAGLPAAAQTIEWHVINRFRLFTERSDFERHAQAAAGRSSILETERALSAGSREGWAAAMLGRTCLKAGGNEISGTCRRDGVQESYLTPASFPIRLTFLPAGTAGAACRWIFRDLATGTREEVQGPCQGLERRIAADRRLAVSVADAATPSLILATTDIAVRHVLMAGLGDSIASGEGNPDRPVRLSPNRAMCFDRFFSNREYWRPSREGYALRTACPANPGEASTDEERRAWGTRAARWTSPACHRSLYSYQMRAALALAIQNPDSAVTFVPLGCSGATIEEGILKSRKAREFYNGQTIVQSQISLIDRYVLDAGRPFDAILLTIGANDIGFSGLVADIMLQPGKEREIFEAAGLVTSVSQAERALARVLRPNFETLRRRLAPAIAGRDLGNVIYTIYGNPARRDASRACPSSRHGFDVHPGFGVDGAKAADAVRFVDTTFFPALKDLARCAPSTGCTGPDSRAMTFVDRHQDAFAQHGFCATGSDDPEFDRQCFRTDGRSFATSPPPETSALAGACAGREGEFRPFASRQRWVRTANDSYFAAMTYPDEFRRLAGDLHDPIWGATSAVYGGAIHPTAEGHAAMADAALADLARRLGMKGWP
ncbi:MAG: hypothetical protein O9322_06720 [Beijerinckiaceae bacterium]|nr:hypothetical protein [Beijerinckiaceae bacterium]MCZ8299216.1 hypothetical protein [Beijerinckiaceae bacterium]